jgi:hypothetical protein
MGLGVTFSGKVKPLGVAVAKASRLNRAHKSLVVDPKPGELAMTRVKLV